MSTPTPVAPPEPTTPPPTPATTQPTYYARDTNPGDTFALVGIVLCFVQLSLIGLFFSIFGYKKSKDAGRSTTFGVLGIVLNAISVSIGLLIALFYATVIISLFTGIQSSGDSTLYY